MNNVSRHKLYRIYFSDTCGHFYVYAFCSFEIKDDGLYIYKNNGLFMSFTGLGMLADLFVCNPYNEIVYYKHFNESVEH